LVDPTAVHRLAHWTDDGQFSLCDETADLRCMVRREPVQQAYDQAGPKGVPRAGRIGDRYIVRGDPEPLSIG